MKFGGNLSSVAKIGKAKILRKLRLDGTSTNKREFSPPKIKFERTSSPFYVESESRNENQQTQESCEYSHEEIARRAKRNLIFLDKERMSPFSLLPSPPRTNKKVKHVDKVSGNFHCKGCNKRYSSNDVWVTRTNRRCVQSTECPFCYRPNKPYYMQQKKASIFYSDNTSHVVRNRQRKWTRLSASRLRRIGY
ncbi:leucine-rich repeat protein [Perkinsela sp. CCAP 1560/4]|nr:leucine-rich repeat protein [Perkinsela sp. CCAP 1560/4]|eukprot:KNH04900.1 leucine-rich repeat protein [Perkinsela sp. CCAP 1560/4]